VTYFQWMILIPPALLLTACTATEQTYTERPPSVETAKPAQMQFETRVDTVYIDTPSKVDEKERSPRYEQIRFMVQIGAFKDPRNANRVQLLARERFRLPVVNDYHAEYGLYQIRIGFFETREAAMEFRRRMQREHPREYADCWVVHLRR
jgi:cell division protein FtsN